jgi:hypothetical protein
MLKKILIGVLILIVLVVAVSFVLPNHYNVSRTVVIQADVAKVHEMCGDLKNWPKWTPWEKADPTVKTQLSDVTTGVGAHQSWTSDGGNGELTLTRCDPATGVAYDMNFIDGERTMPAKSWMNYKAVAGGVEVEWGIEGDMRIPVIGPYFAMCADSMMGGMFQQGLDELKSVCEAK